MHRSGPPCSWRIRRLPRLALWAPVCNSPTCDSRSPAHAHSNTRHVDPLSQPDIYTIRKPRNEWVTHHVLIYIDIYVVIPWTGRALGLLLVAVLVCRLNSFRRHQRGQKAGRQSLAALRPQVTKKIQKRTSSWKFGDYNIRTELAHQKFKKPC